MGAVPYRIETERLVLRCWDPADAAALLDAQKESLAELRPFMPWAHEEDQSLAGKVALLRRFRGAFDLDQDYIYGMFAAGERAVAGGTGLHARVGPDAFEIGYWVRTSLAGRGFATEATAALTRVAFELHGIDRVEIHAEPANARSLAIPRRLGYVEEATLRRRLPWPVGEDRTARDVTVLTLLREELAGSPCAEVALRAFDAAGERLL
jgi:RimJ/RimL family protein N-acetyltransferase